MNVHNTIIKRTILQAFVCFPTRRLKITSIPHTAILLNAFSNNEVELVAQSEYSQSFESKQQKGIQCQLQKKKMNEISNQ